MLKNKSNSFIHIFGLTIGLTGCLLIGLFVRDELKYDTFHPNGDRIYRIYSERGGEAGGTFMANSAPAIGPTLKNEFPEIEQTLRIYKIRPKQLFKKDGNVFMEERGFFAEPAIFDFFHLPLLYGDSANALNEINSIVLTKSLSEKYFGNSNPLGESISINNTERKVTGVLDQLPAHFHLDFNFLVSFENLLANVSERRIKSWVWQDFTNYAKVFAGTDMERLSSKLNRVVEKYAHPQTKEIGFYY